METLNPFCVYCNTSHAQGRACPPRPHLSSPGQVFATGVIKQGRGTTAVRNKKGGVSHLHFPRKKEFIQ